MEWWDLPRFPFPENFVFSAGRPGGKAKKKARRQESIFNDPPLVRPRRMKQKNKITPKPKPKSKPEQTPPQQQAKTLTFQLSESQAPWPTLQKTITIPPPPTFDTYKEPPKPAWFKFLLPYFQHLSPLGAAHVPSSSYMNVRLHALNDILEKKYFSNKTPSPFAEWILGQTLRVLIPMLRVRRLIRRFIQAYKCRQCSKRAETIDPFTLVEAVNPIQVFCFRTKKRYDYDPVSLVRHICTCLRYQNSGFADPRPPKIPQTNEPFSYAQLTSIYSQAAQKGITSQTFSNYRSVQWSLIAFTHLFTHDLQRHAIRTEHFAHDSFIARENITYWIETSAMQENIYLEEEEYQIIQYALDKHPQHSYLSAWKGIIMNYLVECNLFPNSAERKTAAKNNFHKKCVQLLKLFCDFRKHMCDIRDAELFGDSDSSGEDQDE